MASGKSIYPEVNIYDDYSQKSLEQKGASGDGKPGNYTPVNQHGKLEDGA